MCCLFIANDLKSTVSLGKENAELGCALEKQIKEREVHRK